MRIPLSAESVDTLKAPPKGELWISDTVVKGFGVRLWATATGGNATFAIRVRDKHGVIRRESFAVWSDFHTRLKLYEAIDRGEDLNLGAYLEEARRWASQRIRELKGLSSRFDDQRRRRANISTRLLSLTLQELAERSLTKLEKRRSDSQYTLQLRKLFYSIQKDIISQTIDKVDIGSLAEAISNEKIPVFQSRALQSFIGQLFNRVSNWNGQIRTKHSKLNYELSRIREARMPQHPEILSISDSDYDRLFEILDGEVANWRSALALKVYFMTGAKLSRVLQMQWSQIIDRDWFPYTPAERELWFMGAEGLSDEMLEVLSVARHRAANEQVESRFVFPSEVSGPDRPLSNVRRYWQNLAKRMGWARLPLRHVAARYNVRNNPSYYYMYLKFYVPLRRSALKPGVVSKLANTM